MPVSLDLRAVELLASRLCHDLVSPVGAVNNGVELLTEMGPDAEAMKLVGQSAQTAAKRLRFQRAAYGASGAELTPAELRDIANGLLEERHVSFQWEGETPFGTGGRKLLLNMIAMGAEALPRGGCLQATSNGAGIAVVADGAGAFWADGITAAIGQAAIVEDLTARTIQAYFTARLAESLGARLETAIATANHVSVAARKV
jgi:histidine phosphotransferase ChpT